MMISPADEALARKFRSHYPRLRCNLTPKQACTCFANAEHIPVDRVRYLISFGQPMRICRGCWAEFYYRKSDGCRRPHLCPNCFRAYQRIKQRGRYIRKLSGRIDHSPHRYYSPDELRRYALRTLHMSRQEFGEALQDVVVRPRQFPTLIGLP